MTKTRCEAMALRPKRRKSSLAFRRATFLAGQKVFTVDATSVLLKQALKLVSLK